MFCAIFCICIFYFKTKRFFMFKNTSFGIPRHMPQWKAKVLKTVHKALQDLVHVTSWIHSSLTHFAPLCSPFFTLLQPQSPCFFLNIPGMFLWLFPLPTHPIHSLSPFRSLLRSHALNEGGIHCWIFKTVICLPSLKCWCPDPVLFLFSIIYITYYNIEFTYLLGQFLWSVTPLEW